MQKGLRALVPVKIPVFLIGGGGGIRTLDTSVYSYTGFRNRRFQPLSHPSFAYLHDTVFSYSLPSTAIFSNDCTTASLVSSEVM